MHRLDQIVIGNSQVQLAESIGIGPSYLSLILNGRRFPPPRLLAGLRDGLNGYIKVGEPKVTIDEVLEWLDLRLSSLPAPAAAQPLTGYTCT